MSAPRLLYSKAEIKILAGAPGALARPPNLLASVDRSKYEKHISPDRGHTTGKHHKGQKQRPHVSTQISPQNQRWKPRHHEQKSGISYTTRHWDQAPAAVEEDEEPEWADEVVNFNENFDFSQATLERDKDKPASLAAVGVLGSDLPSPTPKMSRFGFALEDTLDSEALDQIQQPSSSVSDQGSLPFESSSINQVRQSRFKFTGTSEVNTDSFSDAIPERVSGSGYQVEASHTQAEALRFESSRPVVSHRQRDLAPEMLSRFGLKETVSSVPARSIHVQSHAPSTAVPRQTLPVPKGKPIEISQMFQMYAMANNLPAPSPQSIMPDMGQHISPSSTLFQTQAGPTAQYSQTLPSALYNPTLGRPPSSGLRGVPSPTPSSGSIRPLSIAGLGQQNHSVSQASQPSSTRSKSSSNDKRRGKAESAAAASGRPKAPVPAATAPPSYVRSYMNMQLPQQSSMAGYYVPPGMASSPAQGFIGQHVPYPPPPPSAPY